MGPECVTFFNGLFTLNAQHTKEKFNKSAIICVANAKYAWRRNNFELQNQKPAHWLVLASVKSITLLQLLKGGAI